jgi:proteasome lid subunit RPN8/RPN11
MINLSNQVHADIIQHAIEEAPKESCGLLIDGTYVRCENLADDPEHRFMIDPEKVLDARLSGKLQAIIHSHPNGPDGASKIDMEQQAEGEIPWGIVLLPAKAKPELFFWGDTLPQAPYEGRVFRHGVADCYALVRDWYRQERGIILPITPRDPEWWSQGQNVIQEHLDMAGYFEGFYEVPVDQNLEVGDVLLAKVGAGVINHSGVYLGNGLVLHHLSNRLSRKDVLGPWLRFVVKAMRHGG